MTKPEEALRKVIDETVGPRAADFAAYLVAARDDALPVARADLLYLWDDYHGEYLDLGALGHPVGHGHPIITRAVADHWRYYGLTAPQGHHIERYPVEYAKQLSEALTPPGEAPWRVLYTEGEREALWQASRFPGPKPPAILATGWHDWLPGRRYAPELWNTVAWSEHSCLVLAATDTAAHPIAEIRPWVLAARTAGLPVIVDDTVTGFGRTGVMWPSVELQPDAVVLGGPVGGGYTLGAIVGAPGFFPPDVDVSSQSGHPMACCAGAALLTTIGLGVLEYMEESIPILERGLAELCAQFPAHLSGHHGSGLWRGLTFTSWQAAARFALDVRAQGLYVAPPVGTVVTLAPVLITSTNEMTRAVDLMAATMMSWDDGESS